MDISLQFKACVKELTLHNEATYNSKKETLKLKKTNQGEFYIKAQKIIFQIEQLYGLLIQNRQAYNFNLCNYLENKCPVNNINQDEIDVIAIRTISICNQLISELRIDIRLPDISQHHQEHRNVVIFLIEEYLKGVSRIYSEQKAIREKNFIKHKKLSKLHSAVSKRVAISDKIKFTATQKKNNDLDSLKVQEMNGDINVISCTAEILLSPEDIQMFESENEQLYNELTTLSEEVKQIETKVVHITELQEFFTQRVLEQNKNLEQVFTTVVGSTENVKEANEYIRKAIQRNAGLRVWILFFLLVMSFTLIFLDWYNP
ncbi:syntaxin-18 [Nasonia vitripennis]|uniref:Syntaxin-18 n=1 Tax=Nasonia vitripennis TaxID=7425 RepID=A0A7M7QQ97_NASVI|nr:syntaxin-18 [Nasonia vitripennis]XP_031789259.1 syntaxin-18 [Nasonia vitripennis]XP_031789260.1 syntaxin-18 [Nasonia vitripennis]XP_031789261.1 syntaxin-18 [Nasonia vitripennis]XP_031789262.1 syntaxin-18 [Nasonia vitripennis]XP_032458137.1 syntaxin-18 [Nasonia vitripennis]